MNRPVDRWIRWTTTGCVALLALIAGTVSYLHMHMLVELHGQPGWVGGADAVVGGRDDRGRVDHAAGRLAVGRAWRGAAVGAAGGGQRGEPGRQRRGGRADGDGRVIAAWPSFALIAAYELLMRQVRRSAAGGGKARAAKARADRSPAQKTAQMRP